MVTGRKYDVQRLIARMEDALACVYQWFCHNGMRLNAAKAQMIVIGSSAMLRTLSPVAISFCGTTITESKKLKKSQSDNGPSSELCTSCRQSFAKMYGHASSVDARAPCDTEFSSKAHRGRARIIGVATCGTVCPCTARAVKRSSVAYKKLSTFALESCLVGDVAKEFRVLSNS